MIRDLIIKNRSYRRFDQSVSIPVAKLREWVELARFSASGRNMQPLRYVLCTSENICREIFPNLAWAGYLTDWDGPEEGERPAAYIVVIHDKNLSENYFCDDGIAAQSILLGAVEDGFGGCIIGSVNRSKVARILQLDPRHEILWVIALGKPTEQVVLEDVSNGEIKYWRDRHGIHHVPKRILEEIILSEK